MAKIDRKWHLECFYLPSSECNVDAVELIPHSGAQMIHFGVRNSALAERKKRNGSIIVGCVALLLKQRHVWAKCYDCRPTLA